MNKYFIHKKIFCYLKLMNIIMKLLKKNIKNEYKLNKKIKNFKINLKN